jgi:iron complex transport system substrate-binding protein
MRVASLLPSATEICYALGVEPVGVSHECDWPPAATDKPALNRSRVDPDADSERINEQVVQAEQNHGSVYEIDLAALERTDPDLIVTQGICDVCAVDTVLVEEAIERADVEAAVLTTDPHSLGDLYADVERIGDAVGLPERAADLVASLEARVEAVAERTRDLDPADRPTVAVLDWLDPVMIAGHWTPELSASRAGAAGWPTPASARAPASGGRSGSTTRTYSWPRPVGSNSTGRWPNATRSPTDPGGRTSRPSGPTGRGRWTATTT